MTLNFPSRGLWLVTGLIMFWLLQSGCQFIQASGGAQAEPTQTEPSAAASARPEFSTNIANESVSPNGEWIASTLLQIPRASSEYYQRLQVRHAGGAPSYTLMEGWFTLLPGYKIAEPLFWSQDSERFYFTNRHQPDGCGLLYNGSDLYRLDLAGGNVTELLPADTTIKLGLAPDEIHVAYQAIGAATIVIHNLESGDMSTIDMAATLGNNQLGAFVWSPDSSAVAFAVAHNPCSGGWAESTSLYIVDAETLDLTQHLTEDDRLLVPSAWPSADTLLLVDREGEEFTFDLPANTVTQ